MIIIIIKIIKTIITIITIITITIFYIMSHNITQSQISSALRFKPKFHFKWTIYGKLILKRYLATEDWFRDKATVQAIIPFQMDF